MRTFILEESLNGSFQYWTTIGPVTYKCEVCGHIERGGGDTGHYEKNHKVEFVDNTTSRSPIQIQIKTRVLRSP